MAVPALDHKTNGYSLAHAYWLCKAASLAYEEEAEIRAEMEKWGFDRFHFFKANHQMPFPLEDTQAFVAASDSMIIVAFRGTEPDRIGDWLTDANTPGCPGPANIGLVHLGFSRALACVHTEILDKIKEFRTSNQTLWFTGHSLGGALAMLAAAATHFEDPKLLADGVYTFGQPRTCDKILASSYDKALRSRTFRFVNNNDIVPQVPTAPPFFHVGIVKYFDADGQLHDDMPFWAGVADRIEGFTADPFAPGTDGIRDHFVSNYEANIGKNLGRS